MPDEWLTFYSALYDIHKSLMAKIEMMQMPAKKDAECDDSDSTLPDEEDRWITRNRHPQLTTVFRWYLTIYTMAEGKYHST